MLDKIPELFGRTFAVGFLLPALLFVLAMGMAVSSTDAFHSGSRLDPKVLVSKETVVLVAGLVVIVAWMFAVLLLALNRTVIRILEGYGRLNPLRVLKPIERRAFRQYSQEVATLRERNRRGDLPAHLQDGLSKRWTYLVLHFPDREEFLLPTRFGNTLRAYETYSRQMFGFDLIPGWYRLMAFIPKDFQDALTDAKALMDFWVNLLFVSVLYSCVVLAGMGSRLLAWPPSWWTSVAGIVVILVAVLSYDRSIAAAVERGQHYKGAVDVYLPQLYERVKSYDRWGHLSQTDFWTRYSQAIVFHAPAVLNPSTSDSRSDGAVTADLASRPTPTPTAPLSESRGSS